SIAQSPYRAQGGTHRARTSRHREPARLLYFPCPAKETSTMQDDTTRGRRRSRRTSRRRPGLLVGLIVGMAVAGLVVTGLAGGAVGPPGGRHTPRPGGPPRRHRPAGTNPGGRQPPIARLSAWRVSSASGRT